MEEHYHGTPYANIFPPHGPLFASSVGSFIFISSAHYIKSKLPCVWGMVQPPRLAGVVAATHESLGDLFHIAVNLQRLVANRRLSGAAGIELIVWDVGGRLFSNEMTKN